jgi:hypothetical protein
MLRVIICGSREFTDLDLMAQALTEVREWADNRPLTIVHGRARGADSLADSLTRVLIPDAVIEPHPADWNYYGKSAGPIRNAEMVSLGADLGLAFYIEGVDSRGTNGCVALMQSAGIAVKRYTQPGK